MSVKNIKERKAELEEYYEKQLNDIDEYAIQDYTIKKIYECDNVLILQEWHERIGYNFLTSTHWSTEPVRVKKTAFDDEYSIRNSSGGSVDCSIAEYADAMKVIYTWIDEQLIPVLTK